MIRSSLVTGDGLVKSAQELGKMTIGEKIIHYRKLQRWTQSELAEKIGVGASHISRWENDRVRPNSGTLQKLADALNISMSELMGEAEPPPLASDNTVQFLKAIERLEEEDRKVLKHIIDALLTKKRVKAALEAG